MKLELEWEPDGSLSESAEVSEVGCFDAAVGEHSFDRTGYWAEVRCDFETKDQAKRFAELCLEIANKSLDDAARIEGESNGES